MKSVEKMMTILVLSLLLPSVLATNVSVEIASNESVVANTTIYSPNVTIETNVNSEYFQWYINGYPGSVPVVKNIERGLDMSELLWHIESAIDFLFGKAKRFSEFGMSLLADLSKIFVTREEFEQQQENMDYLLLRIRTLEHALERINQTAYCKGKIDTMFEYNLTYVECGGKRYYNMLVGNKRYAVTVEPLE